MLPFVPEQLPRKLSSDFAQYEGPQKYLIRDDISTTKILSSTTNLSSKLYFKEDYELRLLVPTYRRQMRVFQ